MKMNITPKLLSMENLAESILTFENKIAELEKRMENDKQAVHSLKRIVKQMKREEFNLRAIQEGQKVE